MRMGVATWSIVLLSLVIPYFVAVNVEESVTPRSFALDPSGSLPAADASFQRKSSVDLKPSATPDRVADRTGTYTVANPFGPDLRSVRVDALLGPDLPLGSSVELGVRDVDGVVAWRPIHAASAALAPRSPAWTAPDALGLATRPLAQDPHRFSTFTADDPRMLSQPVQEPETGLQVPEVAIGHFGADPDLITIGLRADLHIVIATGDAPTSLRVFLTDLNNDAGPDGANLTLSSIEGGILETIVVPDDGNTGRDGRSTNTTVQFSHAFEPRTWYQLRFAPRSSDMGIRSIAVPGAFRLSDTVYFGGPAWKTTVPVPFKVHLESPGGSLEAFTSAAEGLQSLKVAGPDGERMLELRERGKAVNVTLPPGKYTIHIEAPSVRLRNTGGWLSLDDSAWPPRPAVEETESGLIVRNVLRGNPVLWTYAEGGHLRLELDKQDLNWQEGADTLTISVRAPTGVEVGRLIVPDDGNARGDAARGAVQTAHLELGDLEPQPYRLVFSGTDDYLLRRIAINQRWLVGESAFLIGLSPCCYPAAPRVPNDLHLVYGTLKDGEVSLHTSHAVGYQTVTLTPLNGTPRALKVDRSEPLSLPVSKGLWTLALPAQDIRLRGPGYFAFTDDSFFFPFVRERLDRADAEYLVRSYDPRSLARPVESGLVQASVEIPAAGLLLGAEESRLQISLRIVLPAGAPRTAAVDVHGLAVTFTPTPLRERFT